MSQASLHDEHAHGRVPPDRTVSGARIAMVKIGIIIALPAFISGAEIGFALGFQRGVTAIVIGGLILTGIAMLTGSVGGASRLATAMITQFTFGALGGRLVNVILATTLLGWFGVTAQLFGESLHHIVIQFGWAAFGSQFYVVLGGVLMVVTTMYGFSALQRLSNLTVPLLLGLILFTAYSAMRQSSPDALMVVPADAKSIGVGISAIVGGLAASVTIFPDLCRFARRTADARLAAGLTFGFAMPGILLIALIPSIVTGQRDLMIIMTSLGLGIPALVLLVFKAWATNAGNLYSASLSAASFFSRSAHALIVAAAGVVGVALAALGISDNFIPFLLVLGIMIPPIAGIYVTDFFFVRNSAYDLDALPDLPPVFFGAFGAWGCGIAAATLTSRGAISLSGIPACDSILVASLAYYAISRLGQKRKDPAVGL